MREAVSSGQYSHPEGLFYGGDRDVWANITVEQLLQERLSHTDEVVVVDVHTGLGEFASAEIILNSPEDAPEYLRSQQIWGVEAVRTTSSGNSVSVHLNATLKLALPAMLPQAEVTSISLEYGTVPGMSVLKALRAENWVHHNGGAGDPYANTYKACLLAAFYPDDPTWRDAVRTNGRKVVTQALDWLGRAS